MLRDNAERLRDAHQLGKQALTGQEQQPMTGEDMGDIVITGDIKINDPAEAADIIDSIRGQDKQPPVQMPSVPKPRYVLPASIVTAGALTASGLYYLANANQPEIPPSTPPNASVEVGFGKPTDWINE